MVNAQFVYEITLVFALLHYRIIHTSQKIRFENGVGKTD